MWQEKGQCDKGAQEGGEAVGLPAGTWDMGAWIVLAAEGAKIGREATGAYSHKIAHCVHIDVHFDDRFEFLRII